MMSLGSSFKGKSKDVHEGKGKNAGHSGKGKGNEECTEPTSLGGKGKGNEGNRASPYQQ